MTKPTPTPVRDVVGDALDDGAIERGLDAVVRRRAVRPAHARRRIAMLAVAALAVLIALVVVLRQPTPEPVARADGAPLDVVEASGAAPARVVLSDGSELEVDPGGRLVAVGNDGRRVIALLERGNVRVHVQAGGPRAWTFECGLATVDVVGTRFTLERSDAALRVAVDEGVVLVRGENVPDRARRLGAGESIVVLAPGPDTDPSVPPAVANAPSPSPSSAAVEETTAPSSSAAIAPRPAETWKELAHRGAHREAYEVLGAGGVASTAPTATVEELFLLADVARLAGRAPEAVVPLERIVSGHAGDGRASLAALTLGRLRLHQLGQPGQAAADLEAALSLGLPGALQEDALGLVVQARSRAGDAEGARRAAERYLARHPAGRHATVARSVLGESP